jgi:nitroimidazol reductase NimA-like FMN-containing flavoprotein (pyridoxamine 5'-phosphate oxidase superfamily)
MFSMRSRLSTGEECCTGSEARRNAYGVAVSEPTTALRVRRHPERGAYARETIDAILDEARICHVGFVHEGRPFVIPTIHARSGDTLYVHGSPASRMLQTLSDGVDVCVTVTLLDGIVLARSVYNHSMNYRSAVVLGRARALEEETEKLAALERIVEHVVPGRWSDARLPTAKELKGTLVLELPLDEASAKIRTGPPSDFAEDLELGVWAGVIPLSLEAGAPEPDPAQGLGVPLPAYLAG